MKPYLFLFAIATVPPPAMVAISATHQAGEYAFLQRIISYMEMKNYKIFKSENEINIVYVEGVSASGETNDDAGNVFNDRRIVFTYKNGSPVLLHNGLATINPGIDALKMRTDIPHILPGQYSVWHVGRHIGPMEAAAGGSGHEALITDYSVPVVRTGSTKRPDSNETLKGKTYDGKPVFKSTAGGINQHHGHDADPDYVGYASAGCLVENDVDSHHKFMVIVKSDPRYKKNKDFLFTTTIITELY